ncbi:MAG TPA: mechanosensitive ion channel [Phycisphaerales bacterium]|nr:mechanosensitive ion channel [Phycisphaerales bacterium]
MILFQSTAGPSTLTDWLVWVAAVTGVGVLIGVVGWFVSKKAESQTRSRARLSFAAVLVVSLVFLLGAIITLPVSDQITTGLLGLVGISLAALITLGSTTIFANFMAGLMMQQVRSFRPGDFIRVGEHAGRVTAKGLFHVEIQTEDRDLVTLPNAYLITTPVRVVRSSGTVVWCELSLGYDAHHAKVEPLLLRAIEQAGLVDGFVLVRELGDFAVTYRACGLLEDVKKLITTRSDLRERVLDVLHEAGIEIVSPMYMNQRQITERAIPERVRAGPEAESSPPEDIIFDKADDAERVENIRKSLNEAREAIKALEDEHSRAKGEDQLERQKAIGEKIEHQHKLAEYLQSQIARLESQVDKSE